MPEGHTIHRAAREHRVLLGGRPVGATSPQGRFVGGAAVLDGRVLEATDAIGKHLFYRFSGGPVLHVHLGLYGHFIRWVDAEPPPATPGTRLELRSRDEGPRVVLRLAGATVCGLVEPHEESAIRARLGPDPLRRGADPERMIAALRRRSIPVAAALMDQSVVAGVGNVFRAESLFVEAIDPFLPARSLAPERAERLWGTLQRMLRDGVRAGTIITVDPADVGRRSRRLPRELARYVYKRTGLPCRRCGATVRAQELAGRTLYWCPVCQSA